MTGVRAWLRVHRWALIALAVLAAASIWYSFSVDWARVQAGNPTQVIDVPSGKQATLGDATFSLSSLKVLAGDSPEGERAGVVAGTDVVIADLRVTPPEEGDPEGYISCEVRFLAPSPDGEREWWPESSNPTNYADGEPGVFGCNVAGGASYIYRQFFVVPAGGAEGGTVQVTIPEELPRALHLR